MDAYQELLGATIQYLQRLKTSGIRYVAVSPQALGALKTTPARRPAAIPPKASVTAEAAAPAATPRPVPSTARTPAPAPVVTPLRAPEPGSSRPVAPIPAAGEISDKAKAFAELRERALVCVKCPNLVNTRKNVVWGVGTIEAQLMFIGEAPGADEDEQGEPFVGKAGQLLTKIIQTMGLSREGVYIANILKCRPDTPGQNYGNRPPTPKEMENCLPYLHAQIDLIQPKVIVALGSTAVDGLFGRTPGVGITRQRGKWREYRSTPVMPTYHPSYLLRPNPNNVKREVWEDMLQVMERLGLEISEKQRGYFLKNG